jgi:hypothetical protein
MHTRRSKRNTDITNRLPEASRLKIRGQASRNCKAQVAQDSSSRHYLFLRRPDQISIDDGTGMCLMVMGVIIRLAIQ